MLLISVSDTGNETEPPEELDLSDKIVDAEILENSIIYHVYSTDNSSRGQKLYEIPGEVWDEINLSGCPVNKNCSDEWQYISKTPEVIRDNYRYLENGYWFEPVHSSCYSIEYGASFAVKNQSECLNYNLSRFR